MKRFHTGFQSSLIGIDFNTIEESKHSVFGLSPQLKLIYFNQAWLDFATTNNGGNAIAENFPIGTSIQNAMASSMKDFYTTNYQKALLDQKVWQHEYECSSVETYRIFHQIAYPLKNKTGLIIINSLKVEQPMEQQKTVVKSSQHFHYLQAHGFLYQCGNCRRFQRNNNSPIWDWIPQWIERMPEKISHTICPICYDYYWKKKHDILNR